jgi:hypothetical protein
MGRVRSEKYRFHLDRDLDLVQYAMAKKRLLAGLGPAGARELRCFIAEEGASAVAYVVVSVRRRALDAAWTPDAEGTHGAEWTIEECGDRDPSGARTGAILQALIARGPAEPAARYAAPAGVSLPRSRLSNAARHPRADDDAPPAAGGLRFAVAEEDACCIGEMPGRGMRALQCVRLKIAV